MARMSVRISQKTKRKYERYCEKNGVSMSAPVKEHIEDLVGENGFVGRLPEEKELAKSYKRLHDIKSSTDRVQVDEAESQLANELNVPKRTVRRRILDRLEDRGYIRVKFGIITLNVELDDQEARSLEFGDDGPESEVAADD